MYLRENLRPYITEINAVAAKTGETPPSIIHLNASLAKFTVGSTCMLLSSSLGYARVMMMHFHMTVPASLASLDDALQPTVLSVFTRCNRSAVDYFHPRSPHGATDVSRVSQRSVSPRNRYREPGDSAYICGCPFVACSHEL